MVIDEYGAMMEWWLAGETKELLRETCSSVIASTINLTWCHPGLEPGLSGEKPVSGCLSYGMAITTCRNYILLCSVIITLYMGKYEVVPVPETKK
jgi:hypothetical protein